MTDYNYGIDIVIEKKEYVNLMSITFGEGIKHIDEDTFEKYKKQVIQQLNETTLERAKIPTTCYRNEERSYLLPPLQQEK